MPRILPAHTATSSIPVSAIDRRASILAAARKLVGDRGFREAQMTAVAEQAGVALATLYKYFPSKSGLMAEVVALVAQREIDVASQAAVGDGSPTDRLVAATRVFASRAIRGRRLAHALVAEPVEPEIEAARLIYRRKLGRVFEIVIQQGIDSGELPDQMVSASAACIVGSLFEGLVGPLAFDTDITDLNRQEHATAVVAFCIRAVSGRSLEVAPSPAPTRKRVLAKPR